MERPRLSTKTPRMSEHHGRVGGGLCGSRPHNQPRRNSGAAEASHHLAAPGERARKERICNPARKKPIAELVREFGNPDKHERPEDLKRCDLAEMEEKLLGALYATDGWVEPDWGENVKPCDSRHLGGHQKHVGKWRGGKAPKSARPRIQPFLKQSICAKPDFQAGGGTFRKSLAALSADGES